MGDSVTADEAGGTAVSESRLTTEILTIIAGAGEIVGARTLNRELNQRGFSLSESSVSRQLTAMDGAGLTIRHGQRGRTLSPSGRAALDSTRADRRRKTLFEEAFDVTRVEDLMGVLEARLCIESGVARFAATKATEDGIKRLTAVLELDTGKPGDTRASSILGAERLSFHRALGQECGNKTMVALSESLFDARVEALEEVHDLIALMSGTYDLAHNEHEQILESVRAHDAAGAEDAMARHLSRLITELEEFARSTPPQSLDRLVSAVRSV